jgi:hypothetical protein
MPELTPDALRAAVERIAPSRVPALTRHLFEATTNAQQTQSLAPLRAARLRELEAIVDAGEQDPAAAVAEIRAIREAAEAEGACDRPGRVRLRLQRHLVRLITDHSGRARSHSA